MFIVAFSPRSPQSREQLKTDVPPAPSSAKSSLLSLLSHHHNILPLFAQRYLESLSIPLFHFCHCCLPSDLNRVPGSIRAASQLAFSTLQRCKDSLPVTLACRKRQKRNTLERHKRHFIIPKLAPPDSPCTSLPQGSLLLCVCTVLALLNKPPLLQTPPSGSPVPQLCSL